MQWHLVVSHSVDNNHSLVLTVSKNTLITRRGEAYYCHRLRQPSVELWGIRIIKFVERNFLELKLLNFKTSRLHWLNRLADASVFLVCLQQHHYNGWSGASTGTKIVFLTAVGRKLCNQVALHMKAWVLHTCMWVLFLYSRCSFSLLWLQFIVWRVLHFYRAFLGFLNL